MFGCSKNRWRRAQEKERDFAVRHGTWPVINENTELGVVKRQALLTELLHVTRSTVDDLKGKTILEIGGVYYSNIAAEIVPEVRSIALDPLINVLINKSKKCSYICGIAEDIQLTNESVDYCICQNAIDHMQSPVKALQEIRRVLKAEGKLYISCNVFCEVSRPLFPLFDMLDTPHPHHYSKSSFLNLMKRNLFNIDFIFPLKKTHIRNTKVLIGNIFKLRQLAIYCSKNNNLP